ncbi:transposase [Saccharothrix sp. S26]|uniref:transposase n=1 Tax=Saccharothrix sp. S26 TaxID=2907215 RepID=UPI0035ABE53C
MVTSRFRTQPQPHIIESLPGIGPHLGAELVVVTGGDLTAFGTPGRLASCAGLVPVPNDSGRVTDDMRRALLRDGGRSHRPRHDPPPTRLDTIIEMSSSLEVRTLPTKRWPASLTAPTSPCRDGWRSCGGTPMAHRP